MLYELPVGNDLGGSTIIKCNGFKPVLKCISGLYTYLPKINIDCENIGQWLDFDKMVYQVLINQKNEGPVNTSNISLPTHEPTVKY